MTGSVLTVAGCKGGVGKTTTAVNLGTAAEVADIDVMLIETDLAMASVCDFLDLDFDPEVDPSLHDVLAASSPIEDAIYESESGMRLLPSGTTIEGFADTEPDRLVDVVREARDYCELVLLDTPAGVSRETLLPIHVADDVVVVSTPRVSAVRDAKKTIELAERVNSSTAGLVLTHTGSGSAPPGEDIAEFLGIRLLGSIPVDGAVTESQDRGRAVVSAAPDSPAAKAYRRTLDRLADRIGPTGREQSRTEMEPDL